MFSSGRPLPCVCNQTRSFRARCKVLSLPNWWTRCIHGHGLCRRHAMTSTIATFSSSAGMTSTCPATHLGGLRWGMLPMLRSVFTKATNITAGYRLISGCERAYTQYLCRLRARGNTVAVARLESGFYIIMLEFHAL